MITRFIEQETAIYAALTELKQTGHGDHVQHLGQQEICALKELSALLASLKLVTQTLSSDSECTISSVHPLKHRLLENLKMATITSTAVRAARESIIANFQPRYSDEDSDLLLQEACILDPRFKATPHLSLAERKYLATHLISHCIHLNQEQPTLTPDVDPDVSMLVVDAERDQSNSE